MNRPATFSDLTFYAVIIIALIEFGGIMILDKLDKQHAESEANLIKAVQVIRQGQRDLEKLEKKPRPILPGLEGLK